VSSSLQEIEDSLLGLILPGPGSNLNHRACDRPEDARDRTYFFKL